MTNSIKHQIILEFNETAKILGAKSCLLSILGSYGDTQDDETILLWLKEWNKHDETGT